VTTWHGFSHAPTIYLMIRSRVLNLIKQSAIMRLVVHTNEICSSAQTHRRDN